MIRREESQLESQSGNRPQSLHLPKLDQDFWDFLEPCSLAFLTSDIPIPAIEKKANWGWLGLLGLIGLLGLAGRGRGGEKKSTLRRKSQTREHN